MDELKPAGRWGTNSGHGHVWPRPDGLRARCGGRGICAECSRDFAAYPNPPDDRDALIAELRKDVNSFKQRYDDERAGHLLACQEHEKQLSSEREKARKLVEAAKLAVKGLSATIANYDTLISGKPNCVIDDDDRYCWKANKKILEEALKPYATETGEAPSPDSTTVVQALLKALRWSLEKGTVCRCFKDSVCAAHQAIGLAEIFLGK